MELTFIAFIALAGAAPPQVSPADCPSAERQTAEIMRSLRTEADLSRFYEISQRLNDQVLDVRASNPGCVSERLVPLLIDLVGDPDVRVSMSGAGVLAQLGEEASAALPAMRLAIPKAKAGDQADVEKRLAAGEKVIIGGPFYEDTLKRIIESIEYARDFPPHWQDGLCTRIERRGWGAAEPDDLVVRVALNPTLATRCSDDALVEAATWEFSTANRPGAEGQLPPQLFESWRALSRFRDSGIDAWQVCPVASRSKIRAGMRLADMRLAWIDEIEDDHTYDVELKSLNRTSGLIEYVRFEFEAGREIRAAELRSVLCGSMGK